MISKRLCSNLTGRHLIKPRDLNSNQFKSLLWTALELKTILPNGMNLTHIKGKKITLVLKESCVKTQTSIAAASSWLNTQLNVIVHPEWDSSEILCDIGKHLCLCSDMIFCQTKFDSRLERLVKSVKVPLINVKSHAYHIPRILSHIMTFQLAHGHLENLVVGFVGSPCPTLNTYLCIAPSYGIHIQYCCSCPEEGGSSPACLRSGLKISEKMHTRISECTNPETALRKADVIVLCNIKAIPMSLNANNLGNLTGKKWTMVCNQPLNRLKVDKDILNHENNMSDECIGNLQWIYAAIILRMLNNYQHITSMPQFIERHV